MCTACSCSTTDTTTNATEASAGTTRAAHRRELIVSGMTCGHCVSSVSEELQKLDGVREVDVDLATGAVTVHSDEPVPADALEAAVHEAGYQLA